MVDCLWSSHCCTSSCKTKRWMHITMKGGDHPSCPLLSLLVIQYIIMLNTIKVQYNRNRNGHRGNACGTRTKVHLRNNWTNITNLFWNIDVPKIMAKTNYSNISLFVWNHDSYSFINNKFYILNAWNSS